MALSPEAWMSEIELPLEFKPFCTKCGEGLQVERLGAEPGPDDRVFCPVHGTIGTRQEIDAEVVKQGGQQVAKELGEQFANSLAAMGWDVKRSEE